MKLKSNKIISICIILVLSLTLFGCNSKYIKNHTNKKATDTEVQISQGVLNDYLINGIAWMQKSGEYRALCYQAYNSAKYRINEAKKGKKQRAIIVDVDETILNTTTFQTHMLDEKKTYSQELWFNWLNSKNYKPMPGAVEFLNYAKDKDVEVFYITNRKPDESKITTEVLKSFNYPYIDDIHIMYRDDSVNKEKRRKKVMDNYDVVLFMGDNLNDFSSMFDGKLPDERMKLADDKKDDFGSVFIILPNPLYGDWIGSIYNYDYGLTPTEKSQILRDTLIRKATKEAMAY